MAPQSPGEVDRATPEQGDQQQVVLGSEPPEVPRGRPGCTAVFLHLPNTGPRPHPARNLCRRRGRGT